MSEPIKKYITTDEKLQLDYLLQKTQNNKPENFEFIKYTTTNDTEKESLNNDYINTLQTKNIIFEPTEGEGIYTLKLNGQEFEIHVRDIPDSEGYLYNEGEFEDEWGGVYGETSDSFVSYESDHIRIYVANPDGNHTTGVQMDELFDLTNYDTLYIEWAQSGDESSAANARFGLKDGGGDKLEELAIDDDTWSRREDSLDISSVSVNSSPFVEGRDSSSGVDRTIDIRFYQMWVE